MRKHLLTILFCCLAFGAWADNNEDLWQQANHLYTQQHYDSAAQLYEQLAKNGHTNAELYYNLGNTYYKLNDISHAVLNYERSLRIDPNYQLAEDNLALTQSRIANRIQPIKEIFFLRWWNNITQGCNATIWSIIALIIFIATIALYSLRRLGKLNEHFPTQAFWALNTVWVICLGIAVVASNNKANHKRAVVMIDDTPFMQEPQGTNAQSYLPEGTTIKLSTEEKGWTEVTLPDGRKGWVANDMIEKI